MTHDLSIAQNPEPERVQRPKRLLRPQETADLEQEASNIKNFIEHAPAHVRSQISDMKAKENQIRRIDAVLAENAPTPFDDTEIDNAVKVEDELRGSIVGDGMCTQTEMRRNPPGAAMKHLNWETRNKKNIMAWKNLRLRLQASGVDFGHGRLGRGVTNLEVYRPVGGAQEMNMDNAQIPGKDFHLGGLNSIVFSDAHLDHIKVAYPEVYSSLALLTANQREVLKAQIEHDMEPVVSEEPEAPNAFQDLSSDEKDNLQEE
jgi:hypothetical protein